MLFVVIAIVVLAIGGLVYYFLRDAPSAARSAATEAPSAEETGPLLRPPASDFHVTGGEAHVYFTVPLPAGDVDPVLREILLREAVEVLREKRAHLPLSGVSTVHAHALRGAEQVEVGELQLDGPGELPPAPAPGEHPLFGHRRGPDIFEEFGAAPPEAPGVAATPPTDDLPPLTTTLKLTGLMEAGLRAQGIDPYTAEFGDLVPALLRTAGYSISNASGSSFTATRAGLIHYVEVVDHGPAQHPELSERAVNEFMVRFGQSGAARGLLFTPKYGPFLVYDKERRERRVRFITRERFQTFVDALSIG